MKQQQGKEEQKQGASEASGGGVEGEGSYTATHRYNQGLKEHLQTHDVEQEAESAREALEGDERAELEAAEERGKRGPAPQQQAGEPQPSRGRERAQP